MSDTRRPARVFFLSNIPWGFVWQRHQTLAALFAGESPVAFCELPGVRRVGWRDTARILRRAGALLRSPVVARDTPLPRGLEIARPAVLPATNPLFCAWNRRVLRRMVAGFERRGMKFDLVVNYSASRSARFLLERLACEKLVYDCTDDWLSVAGIPRTLPEDEAWLLAKADLTLVPSRVLLERKRAGARRIEWMPHGALTDRFRVPPRSGTGAPTLLYYGHLHRQHLDFEAIMAIVSARPTWRVILAGPVKSAPPLPPSVVLTGQLEHAAIRTYVEEADVLLLPYARNDYTKAVFPAKSFECLATGRPIVATPLPELVAALGEQLAFAGRPAEWVPAIERALREDNANAREQRIALAEQNTWERRFAQIKGLLAQL